MARRTKDDTLNALPSFSSCFSLAPWRAKPALGGEDALLEALCQLGHQGHLRCPSRQQYSLPSPQLREMPGFTGARLTHLRKLQARQGDRQCRTHVGMLKMEQKLGSKAVGPPPLIMMTLCTRSGYS